MDGDRCPFYPTCSHYGHSALRESPVFGFLALVDRLFYRELGGVIESKYLAVHPGRSVRPRLYDPVGDQLPLFGQMRPSLYREDFLVAPPLKAGN